MGRFHLVAMLHCRSSARVSLLGFLGALLKYPFAVVPIAMGCVAIWEKRFNPDFSKIRKSSQLYVI